ncbi:MAG: response regulator [Proteobacteria bacterium]|nr:response regulator [Desulfobacula sp.]MBU4133122.1 response regulator [Pseudomonadota bacterium]
MVSENHTLCSDTRIKILVMDDEHHILTITQKMLEKFGYSVVLAETGQEAIDRYCEACEQKAPFSMVIMDLTIPGGMGGEDASKKILELDPHACIVLSSGNSNNPVMSNYKAYGLKGVIPKPYRLAELKKTIDQLINTP